MSLLLHISDLHLAPVNQDVDEGDYTKSSVLTAAERQKKVALIRSTLREIASYLEASGEYLDCVVISGDITIRNSADGFKLLNDVLDELAGCRPANDRIVVVPGNHDVAWQRSPFDGITPRKRYANFLKYVRDEGFITPLLDGIDFTESTNSSSLNPNDHLLIDEMKRWIIIPVNSSNFCGRADILDRKTKEAWKNIASKAGISVRELGEQLGTRQTYDIARIQPKQLQLIGALATAALGDASPRLESGTGTVRVAVLHHHLQPPMREEFKPFESLTNLGHFREFLRTNAIDVVLHGHKHAGCLYWDYIYRCENELYRPAHPVFVVAAPAPGDAPGRPILRLLRLSGASHARIFSVAAVPSVAYGNRLGTLSWTDVPLWEPSFSEPAVGIHWVEGLNFDSTYARVMALFNNRTPSDHLYNVVCRTHSPVAETHPPEGYPEAPDGQDISTWFREMVDWWQQESSALEGEGYFTHGSRITRLGRDEVNQLAVAIKALQTNPSSSRGVITLLIPAREPLPQGTFPSFCQLHLYIRNAGGSRPSLEAIAYFRKQEMRYWWPINMAEVMRVQRIVFDQISLAGLQLGAVTTISAVALWSDAPPRAVVPKVDRLLDQDQHVLWALAASLFWSDMPHRAELRKVWDEVVKGMIPPEQWNEDGVPVATGGLEYLVHAIRYLAQRAPTSLATNVMDLLERVLDANRNYKNTKTDQSWAHASWREKVTGFLAQLKLALDAIWEGEKT